MKIIEKILADTLQQFLLLSDRELETLLKYSDNSIKERLTKINDLEIIIYSNDHDPPHFHVKTKELRIDAKFKIEDCSLLSGEVSRKELKKIEAFYKSPKGKIIMEKIWSKKHD